MCTVGRQQRVVAESAALEAYGSLKGGRVAPGLWGEPLEGAQASPCPGLGRPEGPPLLAGCGLHGALLSRRVTSWWVLTGSTCSR